MVKTIKIFFQKLSLIFWKSKWRISIIKKKRFIKNISIIKEIREEFYITIVTNASQKNVNNILENFSVKDLFDLLITQEDVKNPKPSAEGFIKAMNYFNISQENTIIFEDSEIGIQAAINSGANYVKVYGYN